MAIGIIQAKPQAQIYVERKPMVSILGLNLLSEDDEVVKVEYFKSQTIDADGQIPVA